MRKKGLIFVISGPSGSGKTTLLKKIFQDKFLKNKLRLSVSFTTRPKRTGERNKKDYIFISEAQFRRYRREKKILEWTRYLGYYYATSRKLVEKELKRFKHVVLCLDLKGALQVKKIYPEETITIFVIPPSIGELYQRIRNRCSRTDTGEIKQRLQLARNELLSASRYDYRIANRNLETSVNKLKKIILKNINKREE